MWIARISKNKEREFQILKNEGRKYVIRLLKRLNKPVRLEHLEHALWGFLIELKYLTHFSGDSRRIINELLYEMLKNKEIKIKEKYVTLNKGD